MCLGEGVDILGSGCAAAVGRDEAGGGRRPPRASRRQETGAPGLDGARSVAAAVLAVRQVEGGRGIIRGRESRE